MMVALSARGGDLEGGGAQETDRGGCIFLARGSIKEP